MLRTHSTLAFILLSAAGCKARQSSASLQEQEKFGVETSLTEGQVAVWQDIADLMIKSGRPADEWREYDKSRSRCWQKDTRGFCSFASSGPNPTTFNAKLKLVEGRLKFTQFYWYEELLYDHNVGEAYYEDSSGIGLLVASQSMDRQRPALSSTGIKKINETIGGILFTSTDNFDVQKWGCRVAATSDGSANVFAHCLFPKKDAPESYLLVAAFLNNDLDVAGIRMFEFIE